MFEFKELVNASSIATVHFLLVFPRSYEAEDRADYEFQSLFVIFEKLSQEYRLLDGLQDQQLRESTRFYREQRERTTSEGFDKKEAVAVLWQEFDDFSLELLEHSD